MSIVSKAPNITSQRVDGDSYGATGLSVDNLTAIVGAQDYSFSTSITDCGAAYVFTRPSLTSQTWNYQARLLASDKTTGYLFGCAVAVSGDWAIIGSMGAPSNGQISGGAAYMFLRSGTTWTQNSILTPPSSSYAGKFGNAVSIDGSYAVVGAYSMDFSADRTGATYVFVLSGSTWSLQATLVPSDLATFDRFGFSVCINGSTIVAGSPTKTRASPATSQTGAAHVFIRSSTTWSQQATLTASDYGSGDLYGRGVAIVGNYIVIGAMQWDSPTATDCGAIYVYLRTSTTWSQQAILTIPSPGGSDILASSISMTGDVILAPCLSRDVNGIANAGSAYAWTRNGTAWTLAAQYISSSPTANDNFGNAVAAGDGYALMYAGTDKGVVANFLPITINAGAITSVAIFGQSTGAIAASTVSGGAGGTFTYAWTSSSGATAITTQTLAAKTSLKAGTYTLTATDTVGNSGSYAFVVNQNPQLVIAPGAVTNVNVFGDFTGSIGATVASGGNGVYTYLWTFGTGTTAFSSTTTATAKTNVGAGTYTIKVTDGVGANASYTYTVTQNPQLVVYAAPATNATSGISNGSIGLKEISWTFSMGTSTYRKTTPFLTDSSTGTAYQASTVDRVDSTYSGSFPVGVDSNAKVSVNGFGGSTTALPSVTAWTYEFWARASNNDGTRRQLTQHAANGNQGVQLSATQLSMDGTSYTAFSPWTLTSNASTAWHHYAIVNDGSTVYGYQDGSLIGTASASKVSLGSVLSIGSFGFVGFVNDFRFTIGVKYAGAFAPTKLLSETYAPVSVTYSGGSGSGYTITWTSGLSGDSAAKTALAAGTYTLTVKDSVNATVQKTIVVGSNAVMTLAPGTVTPVSVYGRSTGSIGATVVTGGSTYYTVSWTGLTSTTLDAKTGLAAGSYAVTATDTQGETVSYTYVMTQNPVISLTPGAVAKSNFSASTGSIGATGVTGGTGTYVSYGWTSSAGATTISSSTAAAKTGLSAGTYTLLVIDSAGATASYSYIVTEWPQLVLTPGPIGRILVNGQATGTIGATSVSGGTGSYVTSWTSSPGASVISDSSLSAKIGLVAGVYTLTVTDSGGVTSTYAYNMTQNDAITFSGGIVTSVNVNGQATGAISAVTVLGGTGSYNVSWSSTATTISDASLSSKTGLRAGTYTLSVLDTAGATGTSNYVISENLLLTVTPGAVTDVTINGQSTGSIASASVSGGNSVYTYTFNGTQVSSAGPFTSLAAGSYPLTVSDSVGASASHTYVVNEPGVLVVVPGDITAATSPTNADGAIGITTFTGGSGTLASVVWTVSPGATDITADTTLAAKSLLLIGTYTVTITDTAGASATYAFVVTNNPPIVIGASAVTNVLINGQATGAIAATSVTGGSGTFVSYAWTKDGKAVFDGTVSAKTGLIAGTYILTVQDSAGTKAQRSFTITENPKLVLTPGSIQNVNIFGQSTGSFGTTTAVGGFGAYSIAWTGPVASGVSTKTDLLGISSIPAGSYVVTVTDSVGAVSTYTYVVTQNALFQLFPGTVKNCRAGFAEGVISGISVTGGAQPYAVTWTPSSLGTTLSTKSGLAAGTYNLSVVDTYGVTVTHDYVIVEFSALTLTPGTVTNVGVYGASTGSISATTIAGGDSNYTYVWQSSSGATAITSQTPSAKTGLKAGTYILSVTDGTGTSVTQTYVITENPQLILTPGVIVPVQTQGGLDGSIGISSVAGGDGVYSVLWSSGEGGVLILDATLGEKTGLSSAQYTLTVSDASGASVSYVFDLYEFVPVRIERGAVTDSVIKGKALGEIAYSRVRGGTGTFFFSWQSNATNVASVNTQGPLSELLSGSYTFTVTDTGGNTASEIFNVGEPVSALRVVPGDVTDVDVFGNATGSISKTGVEGGVEGSTYTIRWSDPKFTRDFYPKLNLTSGFYTMSIIADASGEAAYYTHHVQSAPQPIISPGVVSNVNLYGADTGVIRKTNVSGGSPPYQVRWRWSRNATPINAQDLNAKTNLGAGTYRVYVTDSAGAQANYVYDVRQNGPLVVTGGAVTNVVIAGRNTGAIDIASIRGGGGQYGFKWSSLGVGATDVSANVTPGPLANLAPGVYRLDVGDQFGATSYVMYTVVLLTPAV